VPGVFAFGEVDGIWQRYNNSIFDTNGYRVLGGIGTDAKDSLVAAKFTVDTGFNIRNSNNCPVSVFRKTRTVRSLAAVSITTQRSTGRLLHRSMKC
jgi:hypothetical protein